MAFAGLKIGLMTCFENCLILTGMALRGRDVADGAMSMFEVVPVHEVVSPGPGLLKAGETARGEFWPVFGGFEQGFDEGIVVRDAWARVRRFDPQPVEHREHGGGLERAAVIPVQNGFGWLCVDVLTQ